MHMNYSKKTKAELFIPNDGEEGHVKLMFRNYSLWSTFKSVNLRQGPRLAYEHYNHRRMSGPDQLS